MEKVSILIVDSEAIIAADLAQKVEQMGFQVSGIAYTSEDAVEIAKRLCPQVVLVCLNLVGSSNGIETANVIQKLCNELPVIFLSCDPDMNTIDGANITGPYGCIQKPFERSDLVSQIEKVLKDRSPCQERIS